MALPSPEFRLNGGAPGVKASVSAGGLVRCTLDDTTGVTYVEWSIITTDETTAPGDYVLSTTGGAVPGAHTMTFNAGAAATSGIIRAQINHGINTLTGNAASEEASDVTIATAKWYVPTGGAGFEMLADGEEDESHATHGKTGEWNQAARAMGGGGAGAFTYIELGSGTKASIGLVRMSRNFVALACKTAASTNHAILTEDNADGFQWGDSTLTAQWITDVKTGGAWYLRVNGATIATINASGIGLAAGTAFTVDGASYGSTNVTLKSASTSSILKATPGAGPGQDIVIRAATGGDAGSVGGNLTIGPGIGGTADVVAGGSMTFAMQSDGAASGSLLMTGGALGTFLTIGYDNATTTLTFVTTKNTLRFNAATTIDFQINGTTEASITASGMNVISGNTYAVNGVGHATAATASSLPFRGASGEASFAYIYPAGTVAASGIVRLPSTAVAVAFRDSGNSVDIDALSVAGDDVVHLAKTNALGASIMGEINVASNAIGFYGVAAQAQPSVTGSRGGNAALASLLTALDTLGLIVDNTSA